MGTTRKLILHIGTEKTGTTSIQQYLSVNRKEFLKVGILVPESLGGTNHRFLASIANDDNVIDEFSQQLQLFDIKKRAGAKKQWWDEFTRELSTSNTDRVVLSSEHLQSRLTMDSEIERLKGLLSNLFTDIKICLYLREPLETVVSMFSTAIKSGSTARTIPEPSNEYFRNVVDHASTIRRWSQVFGKENMIVRLYARDEIFKGNIIDDFCMACNLKLTSDIRSGRHNESLNDFGLRVLRNLNTVMPAYNSDSTENVTRDGIVDFFEKHFTSGKKRTPTKETVRLYDEYYAESNEWVRLEFFSDRTTLFEKNIYHDTSVETEDIDEGTEEDVASAILDLWLKRRGKIGE